MHIESRHLIPLKLLEETAHSGSPTGAAERVGTTQPVASRARARLRRQLQDPLKDRFYVGPRGIPSGGFLNHEEKETRR